MCGHGRPPEAKEVEEVKEVKIKTCQFWLSAVQKLLESGGKWEFWQSI
jgi:hypothetical protein